MCCVTVVCVVRCVGTTSSALQNMPFGVVEKAFPSYDNACLAMPETPSGMSGVCLTSAILV